MARLAIRAARPGDAAAISRLVVRTLRASNTRDYPPEIIAAIVANFTPERIAALLSERDVLVACLGPEVVGTASLAGATVRTSSSHPATSATASAPP